MSTGGTAVQSLRFVSLCEPYFDDSFWQAEDYYEKPLISWVGDRWFYDGNINNCSGCGPSLLPIGDWVVDFRPTAIEFTIRILCGTIRYNTEDTTFNPRFELIDTNYNSIIRQELSGLEKPGIYQFKHSISLSQDILSLSIYCGSPSTCSTQLDRPFELLSLHFCNS